MADKTISLTAATPTPIDRTDLLARLRVELHDEDSSNYRWTSATLHRHIERAVREVSQAWPRERLTVLTSVANSRDIDVSSNFDDLVRIDAIEWPIDQEPRVYIQWSLYQDTLTLLSENIPGAAGDSEPADPEGTLYADDVDDAAAFGSGANDISGRTPTMATVAVDESDLLNEDVNFVDLADVTLIVQEIVDRGTWSSGNALALIFQAGTDGARDFQVHHYDLDPTHGAKLVITYTTASPPAEAYVSRVATPGSGSTFSSWSSLDAEISALGGIALAVDSDTVYAFMVDDDLTTIVVRTSTDNGATWSSRATVTAAGLTGRHTSRPPRRVTTISCCSTRRRTGRSTPCAGTAAPGGRRQRGRTRCWR